MKKIQTPADLQQLYESLRKLMRIRETDPNPEENSDFTSPKEFQNKSIRESVIGYQQNYIVIK